MPDGPHCRRCRHYAVCVLAQKQSGQVCGWYNAPVQHALSKQRTGHRLRAVR